MPVVKELTHYGVLGMKWGKRKGRSGSGWEEESRKAWGSKVSSVTRLSNKQLADANKRMRLEKDFNKLRTEPVLNAKKVLGNVLKGVGAITITKTVVVNVQAAVAMRKLLN